jgi:methionyl-tRNA formyltransferase
MTGVAAPARVVFAGSGPFGRSTLRVLHELAATGPTPPIALVGVLTVPARPVGRSGRPRPTPIAALADALGVAPVLAPERLRTPEAIASVVDLGPDLLVVADYGRIVPESLLGLRHEAVNIHPSRLPRHRGASPIPATILAGDADTAVTLIRMDAGIDTGPILAVSDPVSVPDDATAPSLEAALEPVAAELLRVTLPSWIGGAITPVPQPAEGATLTHPLRRDDGRLDPARPAFVLERMVRAFDPWPGTVIVMADDGRLAVHRAAVAASLPEDVPGRLVADGRGVALATIDGRLRLLVVQAPGSQAMDSAAYVRGHPAVVGAVVSGAGATMADR